MSDVLIIITFEPQPIKITRNANLYHSAHLCRTWFISDSLLHLKEGNTYHKRDQLLIRIHQGFESTSYINV